MLQTHHLMFRRLSMSQWTPEYRIEYDQKRYQSKRAEIVEQRKQRRQNQQQWLREYKQTLSCVRCGESHPACLDFHHRDAAQKDFVIANNLTLGRKRILAEISKCDVLCANCHRKEHNLV